MKPIRIDPMIAVGVIETDDDGTWHIGLLLTGGDRTLVACHLDGEPVVTREVRIAVNAASEAMWENSDCISRPLSEVEKDLPR